MVEHKNIQNPDEYGDGDYAKFEMKLFSNNTKKSELENICMILAHIPDKRAQDLLKKFKDSDKADEVEWLDIAAEEGQFHYLSPSNEQEERDYLALKIVQEIEDQIIELEVEYDNLKLDLEKKEIEQEAIKELVKNGEIDKDEELGFHDYKIMLESQMEDLEKQIFLKEKIFEQIKKSIKTKKYKDVDSMYMRNIHF